MTHSAPSVPPSRYGPPPTLGVSTEAGGFLATCVCGWLRWTDDQTTTSRALVEHEKKCKGAPVKAEQAAPKRAASSTGWKDRTEGSSWIDRL